MRKIFNNIIILFVLTIIFIPNIVSANIICNDGTRSPSCTDCHKGCCSKHGGCSSSSSSSSSSSKKSSTPSTSTNKKTTTPKVVKSSDTSLKKITVDEEDITIANDMVYETTKESLLILVVANDSKATLDYEKNPDLTIGENVINIKVTAENGNVKNYKLSIIREKILSANKNIKIFVDGKEVTFNLFRSDIINISNDKENIDITYELEDSNAYAEILGNENLQVGHNEIIVRVTAENDETQDYILIVEKEDLKKEEDKNESDEVQQENQVQDDFQNDDDASVIAPVLLGTGLLGGSSYLIYKKIKKN